MPSKDISEGVVHRLPNDLRKTLLADENTLELWENITPLARNEWICWVEDAKREDTRLKRINRVSSDLKAGKRRPCCWPGCPHRKKKLLFSFSYQFFIYQFSGFIRLSLRNTRGIFFKTRPHVHTAKMQAP